MPKPITEANRPGVLAARIRDLRERHGLTQEEVAHHLGLNSRAQMSFLESGKRRVLALEAASLARLFKVPLERLMEGL